MSQNLKNNSFDGLPVRGNVLVFHAFDIGESINLAQIKSQKLIKTTAAIAFPHFKNYHIPLFVEPPKNPLLNNIDGANRTDCIYARLHNFGAISFCYKIPFCGTFDTLKVKVIQHVSNYRKIVQRDAKAIFDSIFPAVEQPSFFSLKSEYYAVQVNNLGQGVDTNDFIEQQGSKIASLLKLETENLSEFQEHQILRSMTGYYGKDLVIIDSEGAFIYDNEFYEAIEFFELANIQKLELQSFDRALDQELTFLHKNEKYKLSPIAYIPLIGISFDFMLDRLVKLKLDVSVVTERLGNGIKLAGDSYYAHLWGMLVEKLRLSDWKTAIGEKMNILNDIYMVRKSRVDNIRNEIANVAIIIFLVIEVLDILFRHIN